MASHRAIGEAAVIATTVCRVSVCLGLELRDFRTDAFALAALSFIALWQELKSTTRPADVQRTSCLGYHTRQASSDGVAVAAIAVPCTLAALCKSLQNTSSSGWALFTLRSSIAASTALLGLAWVDQGNGHATTLGNSYEPLASSEPKQISSYSRPPETDDNNTEQRHGINSTQESADHVNLPAGDWWQWALLVTGLALVLSPLLHLPAEAATGSLGHVMEGSHLDGWVQLQPASSRRLEKRISLVASAVGAAVNASAAAGSVHMMLRHLPNCFTFGEAMVLGQALTYLMTDVLLLMASLMSQRLHGDCIQGLMTRSRQLSGHHIRLPGCQSPTLAPYDVTARTEIGLFVELLLFAALVCALVVTPLARSLFGDASGSTPALAISTESVQAERPTGQGHQAQETGRSWQKVAMCAKAALLLALLAAAAAIAVQPALLALQYAAGTRRRMAVMLSWVIMLVVALPLMDRLARSQHVPTIIVRKGYHILALALFLPALLLEPQLLALSLGIAAAALVAAEILRVGRFPLIGPRIHSFMTAFIDSRDCGLLLISHFSLLLGMAAPIWLCLPLLAGEGSEAAFVSAAQPWLSRVFGSWAGDERSVSAPAFAFAGIMILGVADSAASAVGRAFGKHRLLRTHKSIEGTSGGVFATLLAWSVLALLLSLLSGSRSGSDAEAWWNPWDHSVAGVSWASVVAAVIGSCLLEAVTTQLDNIFLPLHHCTLLALG